MLQMKKRHPDLKKNCVHGTLISVARVIEDRALTAVASCDENSFAWPFSPRAPRPTPNRSVRTRPTDQNDNRRARARAGMNPKRLFMYTLLIESNDEWLPMEDRVLCCVSRLEMTRHRSYGLADGNLYSTALLTRCNRSGRSRS